MKDSIRRQLDEQQEEIILLKRQLESCHKQAKKVQKELKENEQKFRSLVENIPGSTYRCLLDQHWTMLYISNGIEELSGYPASDFCGKQPIRTFADIMHKEDLKRVWDKINRKINEKKPFANEYRVIDKQGMTHFVYSKGQPVFAEDGSIEYLDGCVFDITKLRMAEASLRKNEACLSRAEHIAHLGSWEWDRSEDLVYWSDEMYRILGFSVQTCEASFKRYLQHVHPKDKVKILRTITSALNGESFDIEHSVISNNGEQRFVHAVGDIERNKQGRVIGMVGIVHDISERKRNEQVLQELNKKLQKQSYFDSLTGIANRRMFDTRLQQEWDRCIRENQPLSLIVVDIDYFKHFNDHYGHQSGDECLIQVAQSLAGLLKRSMDLCARYGGEEFVLLLPNTNLPQATQLAEKCRENIYQLKIPHVASKISDVVTFSAGVSGMMPDNETMPAAIIKNADDALYLAKKNGRNRVHFWDESS